MGIESKDQQVKAIGLPIIENIINAHVNSNYTQLTKHFTDEMKSGLTIEKFEQAINTELGKLGKEISTTYLGCITKSHSYLLLWKVTYEKSSEEILWQTFLTDLSETAKVGGLRFG